MKPMMTGLPAAVVFAVLAAPAASRAQEAEDWNALAARVSAEEAASSTDAVHAAAMVQCAMESAQARAAWLRSLEARDFAAAIAAHNVLSQLYPERAPMLDGRLVRTVASLSDASRIAPAFEAGASAAADVLLVDWPARREARDADPPQLEPLTPPTALPRPIPGPVEKEATPLCPWWRDPYTLELLSL